MFVLIWATLLLAMTSNIAETSNSAETAASPEENPKITAEAGLCVVIPCHSNPDLNIPLKDAVWYKCEQNCSESVMELGLNNLNPNAKSGFRGRVSLLEPDRPQRNYSIIINDLTVSDSGSYQIRQPDRANPLCGATITVKDLTQKPTLMIPPLTKGQKTTLTCTAPGLCSGSVPKITWTWRGTGEKDSYITGNITDFKTENMTAVTWRHSSNLTFNPSGEHHGSSVTCKVSFTNNINTEETVTLNVTYVKTPKISGKRKVKEDGTLNLTCSVDSFPPSLITWTKLGQDKSLLNDTGTATLIIPNVTTENSGQYICTAKHLDNSQKRDVNITVTYVKTPEITGKRTVEEGDTLNLTCHVESAPLSLVMWTKVPSNKNLHNGSETDRQNTGTATLVIHNVTAEHTGQYICTAKHSNKTVTMHANVTVDLGAPRILNRSGCINRSEALTCICISQGFPLPTIKWLPLENHTEYSVFTVVSKHAVNSTIVLTAKDQSNTAVECISSNVKGEVKQNLVINKVEQGGEDHAMKLLRTVTQLEVIIAFLSGALLSAIICCLACKCHRKKQRTYGNLAETLEMVTTHQETLIDAVQAVEDDQAMDAAAAGEAADAGRSEVEYSNLDFSFIKRQNPAEAGATQETTETEYAEIKKDKIEERQDGEGREEEGMIWEDEETKHCVPDEEEDQDTALYSTVKDVMEQI